MTFEERAAAACAIPQDYGMGWMTRPARDMCRIAAFAGFDMRDLTIRLAKLGHQVQERHVLAMMQVMEDERNASALRVGNTER